MEWFKALEIDELAEGRLKSVSCGPHTVCMTHHNGTYAALDNACPHQGRPLVIALTGQVQTQLLGRITFQEVGSPDDLEQALAEAIANPDRRSSRSSLTRT